MKVNQNCLNLTDADLQGRGQANNEPSIAVDPFSSRHLVASDNNYIRGDGTCGSYFSQDGGRTWSNTTVPNGFTKGPALLARQYWQGGGDTSVAWDTRGNAYISCQLFNRGQSTSSNPDQSSTFVVFRATQNNGASWNFPGRYTYRHLRLDSDVRDVLEDKALMTIDDNVSSPYRDRIYVTWTAFAADGIGLYLRGPFRRLRRDVQPAGRRELGSEPSARTRTGANAERAVQREPVLGPVRGPRREPVRGLRQLQQHGYWRTTTGTRSCWPSRPTAARRSRRRSRSATTTTCPDCDTYQGAGADPGRACVPEKGSSTNSVFRATNYPSGAVDPHNPRVVTVAFGSYINKDSNESNGCVPAGFADDGLNLYTGVKTPGACNNKILLSVSKNGATSFTGTTTDPRNEQLVTQSRGQNGTDQFWQWSAFTRDGKLAVDYYDRQYGNDETTGSSDFSLSGTDDLAHFGQIRLTSSSMPAPTQSEGPNGGQFYGDYVWLSASDKAYPIWSDTRARDLFLCPGTGTSGNPPALCGATEPNGETANDEETYMTAVDVPTAGHHGHLSRDHRRHGKDKHH